MQSYLISLLLFTPLVAVLAGLFIPAAKEQVFKWLALAVSILQVFFIVNMMKVYSFEEGIQLIERKDWITLNLGTWGILKAEYFVGLDGLSFPLVIMAVVVTLLAVISSWNITKQVKGYFLLFLILNAAVIGTFAALDFLLFYLCFEFMLLPMFFLIAIWGGPRREYASIKFFLYTLAGSILILIVMIGLYISHQDNNAVHSFDLISMSDQANYVANSILNPQSGWNIGPLHAREWAFLFLFFGFAIKLPMVPLHTWLPDAHVEAPTPISVLLAAILLKIGGYGLLRIAYPILPDAAQTFSWLVGLMGVISIIYGALNAMASKDLKRLIAYSSVSHMGFVLLGLASVTIEGVTGSVYQMVSHGIISAMLFIIAGVLYDRTHDRIIGNYSGLASVMKVYTVFVLIGFFASLGLPVFSGFIAEVLVFLGAFKSNGINGLLHESLAIIATLGLILGAAYYLWTLQRMFFGPFHVKGEIEKEQLTDLTIREYLVLVPLAFATLMLGVFPQLLINYIDPFSQYFVEVVLRAGNSLTLK